MSDSMETDKNESLAAKQIEEEEEAMKRELKAVGIYESYYSYKEMKDILGFITESKDMANMANDNKDKQKNSLYSSNGGSSDTIPKTNLLQELDTQETDATTLIHSHRANHMSPILDRISSHSSSNPEPVSAIFESRNSVHRRKSSDRDDMFDRLHDNPNIRDTSSHSTNRYVALRSKNSSQETHNMHIAEVRMETQVEHNQKLDGLRINPLEYYINENDVPLPQPERPIVHEREPFRSCKDPQRPETLEKLLVALNLHLKQTAELWHSWHRTTDSKFQWGSPIQVGTAKGSLDPELLTNVNTELDNVECTSKGSHERPNKRKLPLVTSSVHHSSSDDDARTEFVIVKKKKVQSHKGAKHVRHSEGEFQTTKDVMSLSVLKENEHQLLDNNKVNINCDNTVSKNLLIERHKNCEVRSVSPNLMPTYPRRIIPPNPRKSINDKKNTNVNASVKSLSVHNDNEKDQSAISLPHKSKNSSYDDKVIHTELEKNTNDDNTKVISKTEIKPLPIKGLSIRLERQSMFLKKAEMERKRKLEIEKQEMREKEEEERRKKEEFYKKCTEEREKQDKHKEQIQRLRKEKSVQWNSKLKSKDNMEKLHGLREQRGAKPLERDEENRPHQSRSISMDEQVEAVEASFIDNINCPICNVSFPSDKIETHAAVCEQYNTDNDEDTSNTNLLQSQRVAVKRNTKDSQVLACAICTTYRTRNGIEYEDHVNSCLQKQHRQQQPGSYECMNIAIDNTPTSPVRCYRPISEQTDSEIDYKAQFSSNKRQTHHSKKRKR